MKNNRGNILFLILLAVVLFAALSYAVTQSMRGGGKDASSEKSSAQATEVLNYFAEIDSAIQRMMLSNEVKDYQLDFTNPSATTVSTWSINHNGWPNPNCTTNICKVFHPNGGAATPHQFSGISSSTDVYAYIPRILYNSVNGAGTDKADIVMYISNVKNSVCRAINKQIGYDDMIVNINPTQNPTTLMHGSGSTWPSGSFPDYTYNMANLPFEAGNKGTFCGCTFTSVAACDADGTRNTVYHVLVAR